MIRAGHGELVRALDPLADDGADRAKQLSAALAALDESSQDACVA